MADLIKKCKDCGESFTITETNKKWFEDRGLHLPERCEDCRKKRKAIKKDGGK